MDTVCLASAWLMAVAHLALIGVLVCGGPLSIRWPRFVRFHALVAVLVGTVFVLGADCPLTTWQKYFLTRAGRVPYDGGFVEHYLVEPITGGSVSTGVKALILVAWLAPTLFGYTVLTQRRLRLHRLSD